MVRRVLDWCDKKYDEALYEEETSKSHAKAFVSGAAEGLVNGLAIGGAAIAAFNIMVGIVTLVKK